MSVFNTLGPRSLPSGRSAARIRIAGRKAQVDNPASGRSPTLRVGDPPQTPHPASAAVAAICALPPPTPPPQQPPSPCTATARQPCPQIRPRLQTDGAGSGQSSVVRTPDPTTAICRSQAGVISRRQALAAGLTERQVDGRLGSHRWSRILPGVYLAADAALSWDAWAHALLLAAGPGARLVGETTAALRGLVPKKLPITVAIPAGRRSGLRHPNLKLLRLDVPASDRVTIDGFPTTNRLRTAVDVAHLMPPTDAQPILDRMLVLDHVDLEQLTAAIDASRRHGSAQARRLMASANDRAAAESERMARRLLRDAGICGWVGNHSVEVAGRGIKVDLALPRLRIAIEVKGWTFHSKSDRAASDDTRLTDLQLVGWFVIPVGWLTLHRAPEKFIAQVRAAVMMRTREMAA